MTSPCIVFACRHNAWRRNLCKFHHRCRQMLSTHCTQQHCFKPLFANSLFCKHHFREQYAQCLVANCSNRTYTTHLCRNHYRDGITIEVPKCSMCPRPVFVFGKCAKHVSEKQCTLCDSPARALGLCQKHYHSEYYKRTKEYNQEVEEVSEDSA